MQEPRADPKFIIDYDGGVLEVAAARCEWYLALVSLVQQHDAVGVMAFRSDGSTRLFGSTNAALWDSTDHAYSIRLVMDRGFLGVPEGLPI